MAQPTTCTRCTGKAWTPSGTPPHTPVLCATCRHEIVTHYPDVWTSPTPPDDDTWTWYTRIRPSRPAHQCAHCHGYFIRRAAGNDAHTYCTQDCPTTARWGEQ